MPTVKHTGGLTADGKPYKGFKRRSHGDEMTIQQHKHCVICEKAIPADKKFCSDRCESIFEDRMKRAKRNQWMFYGFFAILIGWFLIMILTGQGAG